MMPDLRVNPVSEIDHGRALRKIEHVALGREDEDLLGEQVVLDRREKLLRILEILLPFDQPPQPREALGLAHLGRAALLVAPMRRDPLLGHLDASPRVRICTSIRCARGPITVVCSDWYMLTLGSAM